MYNPRNFYEIFPDFICRQPLKNLNQISLPEKVNISYTGKNLVSNPSELCVSQAALTYITGQRGTVLWAQKSVSSWKLRKNTVIGCKVTLRGRLFFLFLEKLYIYGIIKQLYVLRLKNKKKVVSYPCCATVKQQAHGEKPGYIYEQPKCFGVHQNMLFFELQKSSINWKSFSGLYISIK